MAASDSRARIAVSVTETVRDAKDNAKEKLEQASCTITPMIQPGLDQARTQLFGQRPQNAGKLMKCVLTADSW